eukprot:1385607-Amphidinium_carterae.1
MQETVPQSTITTLQRKHASKVSVEYRRQNKDRGRRKLTCKEPLKTRGIKKRLKDVNHHKPQLQP